MNQTLSAGSSTKKELAKLTPSDWRRMLGGSLQTMSQHRQRQLHRFLLKRGQIIFVLAIVIAPQICRKLDNIILSCQNGNLY